ncbi:MAG: methyltransferase [Myxococcota bacterium]|nr:methyltransferase [Myxococcota bacterium]
MTRKPGFDLAAELARPGFTPGARDAGALVALVAGDDETAATRAAPALASLKDAGRRAIVDAIDAVVDDGAKARLVGVLGLLARAGDADARALVLARMHDTAVRVRRAAASALGKLEGEDVRGALLARWDAGDATPDERRVLAEALGKVGGDAALLRLRALDAGEDMELARRRDRALLMADRSAQREAESGIVVDAAPPVPLRVRLGCRAGLAGLLVDELASLGIAAKALVDSEVELELAAPLQTLFASHLWASVAIRMPLSAGDDLAATLVRAITAAPLRTLLRAWTTGPIRWRLGFASGHKRAVVWRVARDVTAAAPELINDPQATTWDILVGEKTLELVPRKLVDPRFAWRVAEVPAASHPSVAAALVWVAGVREGDRIWDPFCGSAVELVERARRGKAQRIIGSDIDDAALAAARANADAAGVSIELTNDDARNFAPGEVDVVITNPPLGSRVHVDAAALLVESLPNIAAQLVRGGRLVWITPAFRKTTTACERAGLSRISSLPIDLGGVRGHLEHWEKRR